MTAWAKLTKDHLYDGKYGVPDGTDTYLIRNGAYTPPVEEQIKFRLLDDDRELYYEGAATDDALESVLEWGMASSGCTILQTRKDGEWVDTVN